MRPARTGILPDYSRQSRTYDETRAANPRVVETLHAALDGAPGRRLADIGGGTGNYARALADLGWDPLVVDRTPGMLEAAAQKGIETLEGDAADLPLADKSFDAVMLVSMIHHVGDQRAALSEAQRILVPGGALALKIYTREDLESAWVLDYFPSSRDWILASHPPLSFYEGLLPGCEQLPLRDDDLSDASLVALCAHPELMLEESWRAQTSYFDRLERDHPEELKEGLGRLEADLKQGRTPKGPAGTTFLRWRKG